MEVTEFDQRLRDIQREYLDFLSDEAEQNKYTQLVKNLIADKGRRLIVNLNDLRKRNPERAKNLLTNSIEEQIAFQRALKEYVSNVFTDYEKDSGDFFVGFEGSFGNKHVTPRSLHSRYLGNLVCIEGIVTKCSIINPKVVRSVHYCSVTKKVMERKYADLTSLEAFPTSSVYPTQDEDGNPLETEFGLSTYKDHQTISIQEMPEKAPAGQLPRSVDVVCDNDLVDCCKPGDRILVVGSYRCLPNKQGSFTSGTFRAVIIACNISQLSKEASPSLSRTDVGLCKKLIRKEKDIFSLLAMSIAPSIQGHEYIKKAILCLLLGGEEKVLPNGTRLRGDINVLLIGDPSVAKSQLLRYVLATAPRAIPTTGRGSTGVGLTAAVTTDQDTGERRLEAGAMVLADRGVVCIDEFDKMSDIDRTAIHEVMEQGRVTIAKAGIHASLNARCSVLAAANPVYGKYDQYKTPMENINLQDSLLSRFDLLFVMLDTVDEEIDSIISDHVVRVHRYRNPLEQDGEILPMGSGADCYSTQNPDAVDKEDSETTIYEKYDPLLHGKRRGWQKTLSVEFMRKYIHFVKILKPKLTREACVIIAEEYSRLRSEDTMDANVARTQPVTARTLETLIRLATAHAKARMSREVKEEDARAAIELVQYAYFKKVLEKKNHKRPAESDEDEISDDENSSQRQSKRVRVNRRQSVTGSQHSDVAEPSDPSNITNGTNNGHLPEETMEVVDSPASITDARLSTFKNSLLRLFSTKRTQSLHLRNLIDGINEGHTDPFTQNEVTAAIRQMSDDNQVMMADEEVFLI
ncbi:hypothetical protein RI129_000291 [Pyrocoelia pectoralis]|uniref:DNA replication licensing factor MCM3 n=1 Tax=Pyrocoelia pectoralis TaxID=417401 RepID=A0AAN7ZPZ7_9COLE